MSVRFNSHVLNRALQADANRICTQEKMDKLWLSIKNALFSTSQGDVHLEYQRCRSQRTRRIMASLLCAASVACYVAGIFLLRPVKETSLLSGYVVIHEETVPLAAQGGTIPLSMPMLAFGLGTVAAVAGIRYSSKRRRNNHKNKRDRDKKDR